MKLLASLTSPYARKIRIIVAEKNIPFELVVDSPWEANTLVPEINPLGKVPVLVTDEDEAFFDSPVIAAYLETLRQAPDLIPANALDAVRVKQTEALADGICDAAIVAVLESRRPENVRNVNDIERQRGKVTRGLAALEKQLDSRQWLNGANMQLGDIAVGVMLAYLDLRLADLNWRDDAPRLADFAVRIHARDSFMSTIPPAG